jgi:enoyl-CoA hydratase
MYRYFSLEREDNIIKLTIDNPPVNALSNAMMAELEQFIAVLEDDTDIRAMIITGAGEKAFMAGADIKELAMRERVNARTITKARQRTFNRLAALPFPTIAAVFGFAIGAGCELAMACTFRIATETAQFGLAEVNLGIIPAVGGTQRLPRLVGEGRAMEMVLTGERITAQKALEWGLVTRVTPPEKAALLAEAQALAELIASKSRLAVQYGKDAVARAMDMSLADGLEYESYLHTLVCATDDKTEGVAAFLEKRPAAYTGR